MMGVELSDLTSAVASKHNLKKISESELRCLAEGQGMPIAACDLPQVLQHYTLLAEHAQRVLEFPLNEAVETAGQFRP